MVIEILTLGEGLSIIVITGYGNNKTERLCSDRKEANKRLPDIVAEKLYAALNIIHNAISLNDIACLPTYNLHQLSGDRNRQFAMDLGRKIGYRLVIIPDPPLSEEDNKLDFHSKCKKVKCIILLEVTNHYE